MTAEEFMAARSPIGEIHRSLLWNPGCMADRAAEHDAAWEVCGQWTRAKPDVLSKTIEEYEAEVEQRLPEAEARAAAEEEEQADRDRAERAALHDPGWEQARLALLEEQDVLANKVRERDEIISRGLFAAMEDSKRDKCLAGLEAAIAAGQWAVSELADLVSDPEPVPDKRGWPPAERRELFLVRRAASSAGP